MPPTDDSPRWKYCKRFRTCTNHETSLEHGNIRDPCWHCESRTNCLAIYALSDIFYSTSAAQIAQAGPGILEHWQALQLSINFVYLVYGFHVPLTASASLSSLCCCGYIAMFLQ